MKEKIKFLMDKGYLLDPDVMDILTDESFELINKHLDPSKERTLTKQVLENLRGNEKTFSPKGSVEIVKGYEDSFKKREVSDFIEHYKVRYNSLRKILQSRMELSDTISINRCFGKMEREKVSLIGLIMSVDITKNNNFLVELEDPTGSIKVLVSSSKGELFEKAKELVVDEVVGITGTMGNRIVFANDLFYPDVPLNEGSLKKSNSEEYVAFISDLHIGSRMFLEEEFIKFITWLNGGSGTKDQREIAKSVKYLVIAGDVIDGVGVYPEQEEELEIKDIGLQYEKCAELLSMIRDDIKIIISPGNHDTVRLAEPQPIYDKKYAEKLYGLKNILLVTNPGVVKIGHSSDFEGFNILLYHGFSFRYYVDNVDHLRSAGGFDNAEVLLRFLLRKRHLAPSHTSTLFIVDPLKDNLIIDEIPDFFVCGHAHRFSFGQLGKTTVLSGSCWQTRTIYQDKGGHNPEPGKVPIINLKTRDVKVMKFYDGDE